MWDIVWVSPQGHWQVTAVPWRYQTRYPALRFSAPVTLTLLPFDHKIAQPVTPDMGNLSSKFERCMVFCFYRVQDVCPSVHLSVCPSHAGIQLKRLNVSSNVFHRRPSRSICVDRRDHLGQAITTYWTFHDHALHLYSGVLHTLPLISEIHSLIQSSMIWKSLHQF